jgi:hypothetical protein
MSSLALLNDNIKYSNVINLDAHIEEKTHFNKNKWFYRIFMFIQYVGIAAALFVYIKNFINDLNRIDSVNTGQATGVFALGPLPKDKYSYDFGLEIYFDNIYTPCTLYTEVFSEKLSKYELNNKLDQLSTKYPQNSIVEFIIDQEQHCSLYKDGLSYKMILFYCCMSLFNLICAMLIVEFFKQNEVGNVVKFISILASLIPYSIFITVVSFYNFK